MAQARPNYYTNPAFCQKSEFSAQEYATSPRQRALSPERRHPPVGAQKPIHVEQYPPKPGPKPRPLPRKPDNYEEEEVYEEMLVDDSTCSPSRRKDVDNYENEDQTNGNRQYYENGNGIKSQGRYTMVSNTEGRSPKSRYEYIPMQEQVVRGQKVVKRVINQEDIEITAGKVHRYAVIPMEEEVFSKSPQNTNIQRYEIPILDEEHIIAKNKPRYAVVSIEEDSLGNRYAVIPPQEQKRIYKETTTKHRYEYIPDDPYPREPKNSPESYPTLVKSPQTPRKTPNEATQKLHELLITPQKFHKTQLTPQKLPQRKTPDPFQTLQKSPPKTPRNSHPKAQQKLNYTLSTRQNYDKRLNTAVIAPICSSPVQSVYSETTFSNKTESWMNLSLNKPPVQASLAVAALMMILCGGVSSGLCFYMVSVLGRMYYLDFGIISGFACLLLGCLGFRSRNCHWLPNRNYISGMLYKYAPKILS